MTRSIRRIVLETPVLGGVAHWAYSIFRIRKNNDHIIGKLNKLEETNSKLERLLSEHITTTSEDISTVSRLVDDINQKISLSMQYESRPQQGSGPSREKLFADDHMSDIFYTNFEDKFRGTESEIMSRLEEDYSKLFEESSLDFKKSPVLDIGSGRGEFLQLMKKLNISAEGIDINTDMVERTKKKGIKVIQGNAIDHIISSKPRTFGAITGFHLVEHIPFSQLLQLFTACHTALVKDGFVLFETPNPENMTVGSYSFYLDPSHLNPIPPVLLAFALESCGFKKTEIIRLHPDHESDKSNSELPSDVLTKLYGPRDYAVIAYK